MKSIKELKKAARASLKGRLSSAAWTGLCAALMGGASGYTKIIYENGVDVVMEDTTWVTSMQDYLILRGVAVVATLLLIWTVITLFIGPAARVGYMAYNLHLVDGKATHIRDLFSKFNLFWKAFFTSLWIGLQVAAWSILLVVPGIIKGYAFSMSYYVLAERPEGSLLEAADVSESLMEGNKWKYFMLELSFVGWYLLLGVLGLSGFFFVGVSSVFVGELGAMFVFFLLLLLFAVASMYVRAYYQATHALFYRELCPIAQAEELVCVGISENE